MWRGTSMSIVKCSSAAFECVSASGMRSVRVQYGQWRCFGGNIRQHVNPLSERHQRPIELPERWVHDKYSNPNNPFIIDIGCSKGMWATSYAQQNPNKNVLGVDIRQPVIDMALARCENMKLSNIHFLRSNANVDISKILAGTSDSCASGVEMITIQFPDPYFKARQHKRRLVNDGFIRSIVDGKIKVGTKIFLQTDVEELMVAMVEVLEASPLVTAAEGHCYTKTLRNPAPYDLPTEREISCAENDNYNIYRLMVQTIGETQ